MDIVSQVEAASYESKGFQSTYMNSDNVIVFSKDWDSLPITTIKVENKPCVEPWKSSDAAGT